MLLIDRYPAPQRNYLCQPTCECYQYCILKDAWKIVWTSSFTPVLFLLVLFTVIQQKILCLACFILLLQNQSRSGFDFLAFRRIFPLEFIMFSVHTCEPKTRMTIDMLYYQWSMFFHDSTEGFFHVIRYTVYVLRWVDWLPIKASNIIG